jgi:hypothetical protein
MEIQREYTDGQTGSSQPRLSPRDNTHPEKSPSQPIARESGNQSQNHPDNKGRNSEESDTNSSSPEDTIKPKSAYVNDRMPIELWLQKYDKDDMPKATRITRQNRWTEIPEKELIISFPICLENAAFNPLNFERLLKGTVEQFKKTALHFAIIVTDGVNRHNIAKRAPSFNSSPNTSPGTKHHGPNRLSEGDLSGGSAATSSPPNESVNDSSSSSPSSTEEMPIGSNGSIPSRAKCLSANTAYTEEAIRYGQSWLQSVGLNDEESITKMEERLKCKITLFYWREIMEERDLRKLFCNRMKISHFPLDAADQQNVDLSAAAIANFAEKEYKNKAATTKPSYRSIVKALLDERFDQDREKLGRAKATKKVIFNKYYVQEEEVGQIRYLALVGDLINLYIHPELLTSSKRLSERQRISADIEWHDWWARKLLGMMTGADYLHRQDLYRFVSAGYFTTALIKQNQADCPPPGNNKRRSSSEPDAEAVAAAVAVVAPKLKRTSNAMSNTNLPLLSPTEEEVKAAEAEKQRSPNTTPPKKPKTPVPEELPPEQSAPVKTPRAEGALTVGNGGDKAATDPNPSEDPIPSINDSEKVNMTGKQPPLGTKPDQAPVIHGSGSRPPEEKDLDSILGDGSDATSESPNNIKLKVKRFNLKQDTAQLIIKSRNLQQPQRAKLYETAEALVKEGDNLDEQGIDIVNSLLKSCNK